MKKVYEKPLVGIESFEMSQTVALSCGFADSEGNTLGNPTHADRDTCGWNLGLGQSVWLPNNEMCTFPSDNDTIEKDNITMCYNNPAGQYQVFAS